LTDSLYFDTDCLSAFLWVKAEHIPAHLYSGKIKIPQPVYNELSIPAIAQRKLYLGRNAGEKTQNRSGVIFGLFAGRRFFVSLIYLIRM
jgi:hypothetical protein